MATPNQLLEAGALLPLKAKVKDQLAVDTISARSYSHVGLQDPVVKLSADNLAAGDDLTMEFLGFDAPTVNGPVAKRRRQALGFPEWALIHDPQHARYALELVKEFKREARRAKSKPGHAQDGFISISKRLGKSVAHFLPSYWEQVGREFIAVGNSTYASRAFGKAREAEKVHNLDVDESLRQDAFLEFALAGCVSSKALTEYGKGLVSTHDPSNAWKFFRELCVRRTLGGMPPWTSMMRDLENMVRETSLDPVAELEVVVAEILDSPAISRASIGFWKGATKILKSLAAKNTKVAGQLLNLIPKTSSWDESDFYKWCDLLETWDVLSNAWDIDIDQAAGPQGGAAAWFTRSLQSVYHTQSRSYDLLEKLAPKLRKEKQPLNLFRDARWGGASEIDADLADLALELKIKLTLPPKGKTAQISLLQWCRDVPKHDNETEEIKHGRPRDLTYLNADKRFSSLLREAVNNAAGNEAFEAQATGKSGLTEARRDWLMGKFQRTDGKAMIAVDRLLTTIQKSTSAATFQEFPEAYDRLKNLKILPAVVNTLQTGIIDEYGWPELEAAVEKMTSTDSKGRVKKPRVGGQFPYVIVSDGLNVLVLRGSEIVLETQLNLPKGHKLHRLFYLDGDLIVQTEKRYDSYAWWHSQPRTKEEGWFYGKMEFEGVCFDLKEGGSFIGGEIVHAGQESIMRINTSDYVYYDGEHFWVYGWDSSHEEKTFRQFDTATGKIGRKSMPAWFEDYIQQGSSLIEESLDLKSMGDLVQNSPLGSRDGVIGFRGRKNQTADGTVTKAEYEGIDGRRFSIDHWFYRSVVGLISQPGTNEVLPIDDNYDFCCADGAFKASSANTTRSAWNRGQAVPLPSAYFHFLTIRDEAASKTLRKITQKQTQQLLDAAQKDLADWKDAGKTKSNPPEDSGYPSLDAAIRKLLPQLKSDRFHRGLRGVLVMAVNLASRQAKLVQTRDPSKARRIESNPEIERQAIKALRFFRCRYEPEAGHSLVASLKDAADFFCGETDEPEIPQHVLTAISTLLFLNPERIWEQLTAAESELDWLPFFKMWCDLPFIDLPGRFRYFSVSVQENCQLLDLVPEFDPDDYEEDDEPELPCLTPYVTSDSRYLIHRSFRKNYEIIEYSSSGKFTDFKRTQDYEENGSTIDKNWTTAQFRSLVENGYQPVILPERELIETLAEKTQLKLADLLYVWLGYPGDKVYYGTDWIKKEWREAYKLKVKDFKMAKEAVGLWPQEVKTAMNQALLSGDPSDLWTNHSQVANRLADAWTEFKPNLIELPDDVQKEICDFGYNIDDVTFLQALSDPLNHAIFDSTISSKVVMGNYGNLSVSNGDDGPTFTSDVLQSAISTAALLNYRLPVGDPSRQCAVEIIDAALTAAKNPNLILDIAYVYGGDDEEKIAQKVISTFGKEKKLGAHKRWVSFVADDGVGIAGRNSTLVNLFFRPGKIKTEKQLEKLRNQATVFFDSNETAADSLSGLRAVSILRSKDFQAIKRRIKKTPVPDGQYEANPLHSVPSLVADVAKTSGLSEEAAVYYLQLLSLPDPTDRRVKIWNDWTPATIKKLGQELVQANLVLAAKRSRAGRSFFLQGGWEALKAPLPPIETWKMSLFQMYRDNYDRATPPLKLILPLQPIHMLFEAAWKRVQSGDTPRYEEVK